MPFFPIPLADADLNIDILITGDYNETGQFVWWMNNITYLGDFNDPLLLEVKMGQTVFDKFKAMYDWSNYTSVRVNLTGVGLPAVVCLLCLPNPFSSTTPSRAPHNNH